MVCAFFSAFFEQFFKNYRAENLTAFIPVFFLHEIDHFSAAFCSCNNPNPFCPGDQFLLLHHGKIGQHVIVLDIEELCKPPSCREFHPDGIISKYDRDRTLQQLDAYSGIKQDINRKRGHG